MAQITPTDLFPGYEVVSAGGTVTADSIVIPLANFPYFTSIESNPLTGDGRELARQIDLKIDTAIQSLPDLEKPTKMTSLTSSTALNNGNRRINVSRTYEVLAPIDQLAMVDEE